MTRVGFRIASLYVSRTTATAATLGIAPLAIHTTHREASNSSGRNNTNNHTSGSSSRRASSSHSNAFEKIVLRSLQYTHPMVYYSSQWVVTPWMKDRLRWLRCTSLTSSICYYTAPRIGVWLYGRLQTLFQQRVHMVRDATSELGQLIRPTGASV
ncbi:hypothetical protein BDF22DRAFT_661859 [Syncephalis plumigaleata]|nr:hypothetical protein BDF22DRAFT_661859 [Syncephalis plumigaleata]